MRRIIILIAAGALMATAANATWASGICNHSNFAILCGESSPCLDIYFTEHSSGDCSSPVTKIERRPAGGGNNWTTICTDCASPTTDCPSTGLYDYRLTTTCSGSECTAGGGGHVYFDLTSPCE